MIPGHFMNVRMWPQILHHCQACGLDTNVPYRASVFSEAQYCQHCGSVSSGATVRTEQDLRDHAAATANMAQQEELARLFASTMTFSNPTPPPEEPTVVPEHYQPCPPHQPIEEPKKVYASTHYVPPTSFGSHSTPQSTPEPEPQPLSDNQIAEMLIQHNIDPHSLFPSQVTLFRNADSDQRQRLLELWRISPPNLGSYDISKEQANWLETTMAKEEEVARLRYERAVIEAQGIGSPHNMPQEPSRPSSAPATSSNANAEPYMTNGYELLAQREYEKTGYTQATDPVYNTQMENNYGQFAAAREGGMASINGLDDEMIM